MSIGRDGVGLEPHPGAPSGAPSAAAVLAWARARDAALRGLVHALSNRVGTVAAVAGMLGAGDGEAAAESVGLAGRVLAGEGERLEALLALFRAVVADPLGADAGPEPVHVPELLAEVAALAGYAAPDLAVRVEAGPEVRPAVASRAALGQALLAAVCGCAAGGVGAAVVLRASAADAPADGAGVLIAVEPAGAPAAGGVPNAPTAAAAAREGACEAAAWLLSPSRGSAVARGGGVVVTVPALGR